MPLAYPNDRTGSNLPILERAPLRPFEEPLPVALNKFDSLTMPT